jgi:acetyl-CoA acetyltransferase
VHAEAPVPAAHIALERAGLSFADLDAITMHDPFAVNDLWFRQQTGIAPERINERGASLIFGHDEPAGRGAPNSGRFILTSIRQWTREVVEAAN